MAQTSSLKTHGADSIGEQTRARLEKYGLFSRSAIARAVRSTEHAASFKSYQDFFRATGVPLEPTLFVTSRGEGVYLVDIAARTSQKGVLVSFLPMGNPLDPNQLYQTAALASTFPEYRVIAFGNPSAKPYAHSSERFRFKDWFKVAFTHNTEAAVRAGLAYLAWQEIPSPQFVGYSYGALKALLSAHFAEGLQAPEQLILLDPVAHSRYKKQLLGDFMMTIRPLGEYVNRTGLTTFLTARNDAVSKVNYTKGLVRPVNIAIGLMLSRIEVIPLIKKVLSRHPALHLTLVWGTKSELGNDAHMTAESHGLMHDYAPGRVRAVRLVGDKHAFANDLALTAAIVHDALDS